MRRVVVLLLSTILAMPGCAAVTGPSAQRMPSAPNPSRRVDPALMAEYVRQLPIGSRVKISHAGGAVIHGTLMKRDTDPIVVQRRTRLPEEPSRFPSVTSSRSSSKQKAPSAARSQSESLPEQAQRSACCCCSSPLFRTDIARSRGRGVAGGSARRMLRAGLRRNREPRRAGAVQRPSRIFRTLLSRSDSKRSRSRRSASSSA